MKIFGKVHVLVNNAGVAPDMTLAATGYPDWDWVMNVNLNGPFNGIHAFLPLIQSHGKGGHIITTSSVMGLFAAPVAAAYTASKYAVVGMMEALRAELGNSNIGASVFCPGLVNSNIMSSTFRSRPTDSAMKDDAEKLKQDRQVRNDPEKAMDPFQAGRVVLQGMQNNDLYIFSHPGFEQILKDRSEALSASIPRDLRATEKRLQGTRVGLATSIYTVERDRRRCKEAGRKHEN